MNAVLEPVSPAPGATRARPATSRLLLVLRVALIVEMGGLAWLVGRDGDPAWRLWRVLIMAVVAGLGVVALGRTGRAGRGAISILLGIVGTTAGAGIGPVFAAKVGLSTTAVIGFVTLIAGLVLLGAGTAELVRSMHGWWRLLSVPAGLFVLAFVLMPLTVAVNVTNRPSGELGSRTPADLGLAYENVAFRASDGVRLAAWYVPSTNGAALVLLHGAGSTRSAVLGHAVVLARHGYGVLLLDGRGHGESEGHAMDFGWWGTTDLAAAVSFLERRADVRAGRIGAVGISMGGEQAIAAAGSDPRIRVVVAEGVAGMQSADHGWLDHYGIRGWAQRGIDWVMYQAAALLSGAPTPMSLRDAIRSAAPCPILLIAGAKIPDESLAGRFFRDASPSTVGLWVVPGAGHIEGLATHPAEWEARVVGFLDRTL